MDTYLLVKRISSLFVMSEHIARIHPFVAASLLKPGRDDAIHEFDETPDSDDGEGPGDVTVSVHAEREDSSPHLIVVNGDGEDHGAFHARKKEGGD